MLKAKNKGMQVSITPLKLNSINIFNIISDVIEGFDKEKACVEINKYIIARLRLFKGLNTRHALFFVAEKEYIETEWKDMVSMHYINTSYSFKNMVMRFHLFADKKVCQDSYLGFFTLRSIDEIRIMLSMIYPNWINIGLKQETYVMTYRKKIHLNGITLEIDTYPLFVQDLVVTKCAHATILSVTKYLREKHGLKKVKLSDIINSYTYSRVKTFPASGLSCQQMLEVFDRNSIPITCEELTLDFSNEPVEEDEIALDKLKEKLKPSIDSWIESAIPVILGISFKENERDKELVHHVVQIIGHTIEDKRKYVLYDDSGVLGEILFGHRDFAIIVSWKQLKQVLKYGDYVIFPQHEKVYIGYERMLEYLCDYQEELKGNAEYKQRFGMLGEIPFEDARCLLVDNVDVKSFLYAEKNKNILLKNYVNNAIDTIIKKNLPHYLWYCEVKLADDMFLVFLANPTYNMQTTKNIFINKEHLILTKNIGLLTKTKGKSE